MNDRITVHIAKSTSKVELQAVAREVALNFDLSLAEAEALLKADVILLKEDEAEALVAICQSLGIRGKMTKPHTPTKSARLRRQTLPWLLALLGTALLVTLLSLVLPEVSVSSHTDTAAQATSPETAAALPVVTTENNAENEVETATAPEATPQIASETVVGTQHPSSAVPTIASSPTDTPVAEAAEISVPDLFTAARDLNVAAVERALKTAPAVDTRDAYGQTPLMYAAGSNSSAAVTTLLAAGADVNASSEAGWTPLMYAARNTNDPTVVQTLLAAGADASVLNESGQGAHDIALAYNNSAADLIPTSVQPATEVRSGAARAAEIRSPPVLRPGGGTPIRITPRPLSSTPPAVVSSTVPSATPSVVQPPGTLPTAVPAAQDEQRNMILDCLQNWASCGE